MAFELGDQARAPSSRRFERGEALVEKLFVDFGHGRSPKGARSNHVRSGAKRSIFWQSNPVVLEWTGMPLQIAAFRHF
jgi:hypothetical protein